MADSKPAYGSPIPPKEVVKNVQPANVKVGPEGAKPPAKPKN